MLVAKMFYLRPHFVHTDLFVRGGAIYLKCIFTGLDLFWFKINYSDFEKYFFVQNSKIIEFFKNFPTIICLTAGSSLSQQM